MGFKICPKKEFSTSESTLTPTIKHGTEHVKIIDSYIGTWPQISNIFIVHKKDTRMVYTCQTRLLLFSLIKFYTIS